MKSGVKIGGSYRIVFYPDVRVSALVLLKVPNWKEIRYTRQADQSGQPNVKYEQFQVGRPQDSIG